MTQGAVNYTGFPPAFLALGPGLSRRRRSGAAADLSCGRGRVRRPAASIGDRPRAVCDRLQRRRARATPGSRSTGASALVYVLSGLVASVAAIIYVAHLGQARSDAGTGYELDAITAVVLGGTSVFGGRGTLGGHGAGAFALSVLQNGLQLAALPSELTGVLTGVLLVDDDRDRSARARRRRRDAASRAVRGGGAST